MKTKTVVCNVLLGACLAMTLNSCYLVKTVKVPVNQATLSPYVNSRPAWTLEDGNHKTWDLGNVAIRHDSIFGSLYSLPTFDHPIVKNKTPTFRRNNWPHALMYVHLRTEAKFSDVVALPLSRVNDASIHKKDQVASIAPPLLVLLFIIIIGSI